jgi:hypothetical protein
MNDSVYAGQGTWDNGEVMDPARATTADTTLNSIVAWLQDCLNTLSVLAEETDETERVWHVEGSDEIVGLGVWTPHDCNDGLVRVPMATSLFAAEHIAHHDPRAVLARVEAERRILQLWEEPDADAWLDLVVIDLAYGHRFDIPGYDHAWAPKWAGDAS